MTVIQSTPMRRTRGTIEIYNGTHPQPGAPRWYWRAKGRNGHIIADGGEAYKRRAGCINAVDRLFGAVLTGEGLTGEVTNFAADMPVVTVPWLLVVGDRHGDTDWIGHVR